MERHLLAFRNPQAIIVEMERLQKFDATFVEFLWITPISAQFGCRYNTEVLVDRVGDPCWTLRDAIETGVSLILSNCS